MSELKTIQTEIITPIKEHMGSIIIKDISNVKKSKKSSKIVSSDEKYNNYVENLTEGITKYKSLIKKEGGSICDSIIDKELLNTVLKFTSAKTINDIVCYYGACYLKNVKVDKKTTDIDYNAMKVTNTEYASKFTTKFKPRTNRTTKETVNKKVKIFGIPTNPHITPFLYRDLRLVLKGETQFPVTMGEPGYKLGVNTTENNKLITKKTLINGEIVGSSVKIYFITMLALLIDECCILMVDEEYKKDTFTVENLVDKLSNVSNKRKNGLVGFILTISSHITDELPKFSAALNKKNKRLIAMLESKLTDVQNMKVRVTDKLINFKDFEYLSDFCKVVSSLFEKFLYTIAKCRSADDLTFNHSSLTKTTFEPIIRILNNLHKELNDSFVRNMKKIPAEVKQLLIISDIRNKIKALEVEKSSTTPIAHADGSNNPEGNPDVEVTRTEV